MNVSMWMSRDTATVTPEMSATDAAKLMAQKKVRRLLVVEHWADGPHLLGIISAKDVIHAFPPHINPFAIEGPDARLTPTTVAQIMTARPRTTTPDSPIEEAADLMCTHKIGALPVLRDSKLVGIITNRDLQFERNLDRPVRAAMSQRELVTAPVGTTLEEAERVVTQLGSTYLAPNKDLRSLANVVIGGELDLLFAFSAACREELS